MKKIMGHLTGKLSLSILTVIVLLVGVLAGLNGITSMKASGKSRAAASRSSQQDSASATQASSKAQATSSKAPAASIKASAAPASNKASAATPAASKPAAPAADEASAALAAGKETMDKETAAKILSRTSLPFEPNKGQTDSRVQFMAHSLGYQVFLTGPSTAELQFVHGKTANHPDILSLSFVGGNSKAAAQLLEPTGGVSNYYLGPDPSKWVEGVPNYAQGPLRRCLSRHRRESTRATTPASVMTSS